jgi:hypothetical protein
MIAEQNANEQRTADPPEPSDSQSPTTLVDRIGVG